MRRAIPALAAGLALAWTDEALAHGVAERSDLPIPEWLFGWAAAIVLIVSFVALAALWPKPRLEQEGWRPLPAGVGRVLASRPVKILCGAFGVFCLLLTVITGLVGEQVPSANFATTFVYVIFWVGLVPLSVVFGDVFRAFNPWRAIGRAVDWGAGKVAGETVAPPKSYPEALGRWPAAAAILVFAFLELVLQDGDLPRTIAIATCVYSSITFVGMAVFGVGPWIDRAEGFSSYFHLFSLLSPFERREGEIGLRRPLTGPPQLDPVPGTVALLAVMIGTVSFDGASEGELWLGIALALSRALEGLGVAPAVALTLVYTVGLILFVALVYGFYKLGVAGARSVGGGFTTERLARAFVHSLVPIALVYVMAHYLTLLLFQGQALAPLVSDPFGTGADLFGTATAQIDYQLIGAEAVWYVQVASVVIGHVLGLTLAHDRALVLYSDAKLAVRSQYWMLGVMVGFTSLALWLLSQANA